MSNRNNEKALSLEEIELAINKNDTMSGAAIELKVNLRTFKKYADRFGLYKPKPANHKKKFVLVDILNGKHPQYSTSKLLPRLMLEGYKEYKCEICGIKDWNDKRIGLEIDHIDGNSSNHFLNNLRVICPNCHSQTDTYKSRNTKRKNNFEV